MVKLTHSSPTNKKKQVYRKVRVPEMKRVRAGGGDGVKEEDERKERKRSLSMWC